MFAYLNASSEILSTSTTAVTVGDAQQLILDRTGVDPGVLTRIDNAWDGVVSVYQPRVAGLPAYCDVHTSGDGSLPGDYTQQDYLDPLKAYRVEMIDQNTDSMIFELVDLQDGVALKALIEAAATEAAIDAIVDSRTVAGELPIVFPSGSGLWLEELGVSPGADADHEIDIASGSCRDADNTYDMSNVGTLNVDIEDLGANGLDTGTVAASKAYHLFLIEKSADGTVAGVFSLSKTAPDLPPGYDKKRLVFSIFTDGSSNLVSSWRQQNLGRLRRMYWTKDWSTGLILDEGAAVSDTPITGIVNVWYPEGAKNLLVLMVANKLVDNIEAAGYLRPQGWSANNQWVVHCGVTSSTHSLRMSALVTMPPGDNDTLIYKSVSGNLSANVVGWEQKL